VALNTKQTVLISVGVAVLLLIGLVISPAPPLRGGLPNYIDMLQAMRAFGKANEAYGRREYEDAIRYYQEATENAPADNPLIQTTLHFFSASSNHLLYSPTTFDDPQNEEYLDNALDGYEDTIAAVEEALTNPALDKRQGTAFNSTNATPLNSLRASIVTTSTISKGRSTTSIV